MFSRMLETGETCYGREGESTAVHFPWTRFNYVGVHNIGNVVVVYIVRSGYIIYVLFS